jgi:hypothetical protein
MRSTVLAARLRECRRDFFGCIDGRSGRHRDQPGFAGPPAPEIERGSPDVIRTMHALA